ncbi:hypothetical protein [Rhizobium rhizogenes]|uniref:Uncharacterized protein n=1 Tax=Rhizobium rhizogenes NBRC 13257 TaxID=1220581 RepID=A0AA87Q8S2_RHIRH|nr:hypothetical protein [Rhizobium rhizogenes]NTG71458.1 hypothetical protein [Rhizobium rhizogenes]NTG91078.1 hypothetical protein [Rhizobium rhizogenes]TRB03382.1 hypothetical protein EXN67_29095 [Rhizobium rhizogenes]TRB38124.1 hypothetical protein EXN73_28660 [Rhizobium rhizogenes]TRB53135.1 hypothetical protein EXN71_28645 [Rhizobium rhizogenes]
MRIAVLGWGSLIWNPQQLEVIGHFNAGGPPLQIEFSRVSGNGRLTLVVDEQNGTVCPTFYAVSSSDDLGKARENLRSREGMTHINGAGFIDLTTGDLSERAKERHPQAIPGIEEWGRRNGFDAIVWTALASNFAEVTGREFSTDEAIAYLSALSSENFALAAEYIRMAPPQVQTPVRAAFAARWPHT